jgi:Tfp pilus assembly protein PilO
MDKTKTRIILVLIAVIIFGASYFGVLVTEQKKRLASRSVTANDIQASLSESDRLRAAYFTAIEAKKAELSKAMGDAKTQYEKLLSDQPALIDANKRGVSVPVTKTVTTQVPTTVTSVKPQATRKTKTS